MTAEKELNFKNAFVHEFVRKQIAQTMLFISQYNLPLKIEGSFDLDHSEAKYYMDLLDGFKKEREILKG